MRQRIPRFKRTLSLLWIILAAGILLRAFLLNHELWFDEMWSMSLAAKVQQPLDVFMNIHHDNNHYLNTLYLSWIGSSAPWWVYHLPSFVAGSLLLIIVSLWSFRRNYREGLVVALLLGTSFLFVRYSAEARGFMPMTLFGFLAFLSLRRFLENRRLLHASLFWVSSIFAFLWHLTFVVGYLPLLVWSGFSLLSSAKKRGWEDLLLLHLPVLLFLLTLAWIDIRLMEIGGSVFHPSVGEMAVGGLATLLGATSDIRQPTFVAWLVGLPGILLLLAWASRILKHRMRDRALRRVIWIVAIPCLILVALAPTMLMPRYFFPLLLTLTLALGHLIRRGLDRKGGVRAVAIGALSAIIAGNLFHVQKLAREGDRQFFGTVQALLSGHTDSSPSVASNTKRSRVPLLFLAQRIDPSAVVDFFPPPLLPPNPPLWFLWDNDVFPHAPASFSFVDTRYEKQETGELHPFWTLYRRDENERL